MYAFLSCSFAFPIIHTHFCVPNSWYMYKSALSKLRERAQIDQLFVTKIWMAEYYKLSVCFFITIITIISYHVVDPPPHFPPPQSFPHPHKISPSRKSESFFQNFTNEKNGTFKFIDTLNKYYIPMKNFHFPHY